MKWQWLMIALAGTVVAAAAPDNKQQKKPGEQSKGEQNSKESKSDSEALQGTWTVTGITSDGQDLPPEGYTNYRLKIKGNELTLTFPGGSKHGTVKLDTSTNPRKLDVTYTEGDEKSHTESWSYVISGKSCMMARSTVGGSRPTTFGKSPGVMTYQMFHTGD